MGDFVRTLGGKPRPFGDDRQKKGGATFLAGIVLAGAVAAAGGGLGAAASGGAGDSSRGVAISRAIHRKVRDGRQSAREGRNRQAWRRMGLKRLKHGARSELQCAVHSYGEVRTLFLHTPCRSLRRKLLLLVDTHGNSLAVSIVWVRMRSTSAARRLKRVEDTGGSGDIRPIGGEAFSLGDIHFTGMHYHSRRTGSRLSVAEVEPVTGDPGDAMLDGVADVASYLPH